MIKSLLPFFVLLFLFAGCTPRHQVTAPHPEPAPGSFYSSQKRPIAAGSLVDSLQHKDYILIGESHNNACHHHTQARLIELMAKTGRKIVLGLEMVSVERQEILDLFNQGRIDIDELPDKLGWEENWGYGFDLYRPIFHKARQYNVPAVALNLPRHVTRNISHHGLDNIPPEDREYLPEIIIEPPPEQLEMLRKQFEMHEDMIKADQALFKRFVAAQSSWDTKMAFEAVRARQKTQGILIILAGTLHVDKGRGIESRLRVLEPEARIAGIVPVSSLDDISPDNMYSYFCPPAGERMRLGIMAELENDRVVIRGIFQNSPAMKTGLKKGDEIVRAGGNDISSLADLHNAAVEALNENKNLRLEIMRSSSLKIFDISF